MMDPRRQAKQLDEGIFWLIAVPNSAVGPHGLEDIKAKIRNHCGVVQKFNIPSLRVGTLDSLMALSDDLIKKDAFVEQVTKKIARQLLDLYAEEAKETEMQLMVNGVNLDTYLHQFQWDEAKYKLSSPLSDVVDAIVGTVTKLDEDLRNRASVYQTLTHTIAAAKRKKAGNLMVRDLSSIIQPDQLVDSPNLTTLFVVVSKFSMKEFEKTHETLLSDDNLGGGVVPGSCSLLESDSDYALYSLVIFKRLVDDFKQAARAQKYTVRDVNFTSDTITNEQEEQKAAEEKKMKQKKTLIRWCRLNFAEAFIGWAHLKTIRIFVEAILRYGLPVDFMAVLIEPQRGHEKKVRNALDQLYKGLGSVYLQDSESDQSAAAAAIMGANEKFYSYVWTEIKMSLH